MGTGKLVRIIFLLAMLAALSACGGAEDQPAIESAPTLQAEVPAAPAAVTTPSTAAVSIHLTETPAGFRPGEQQALAQPDRPVFLAWPLPPYIGTARISQYPNSAWTWNFLGLNPGYQCPPMFGYLLDASSFAYWRDPAIPEDQDRAQADPHQFEMVECYATDGQPGANGHEGTDIKAPPETPVYSAADGKVMDWRLNGLNSMILLKHCLGGSWDSDHRCVGGSQWYTTYMHLTPDQAVLQANLEIPRGMQLGLIYDQGDNSHLHFEVGREKRSYTNFVNPWGEDESPWLGCMWIDQSTCVFQEPASQKLVVGTNDGKFFVRRGSGDQAEIQAANGIKQVGLWGEHLAVLDQQNRVFDFYLSEDAQAGAIRLGDRRAIAENIIDVQVSSRRVAMLDANRSLWVIEKDAEEVVWLADHVHAYSVSDHRVGYLTDQGDLWIQEGELDADWSALVKEVLAFQLVDNRVAILDQNHTLYVNEGKVSSEYKQLAGDVTAFQLSKDRVGILDAGNQLLVKEGNLRAGWVPLAGQVQAFQMVDYRILVFGLDGNDQLKDGSLYQAWEALPFEDVKEVLLNGGAAVYARQTTP